MRVPNLKPMTI